MKLNLLSIALVCAASNGLAQHVHQSDLPNETGQSQFAAVAEIVTLLRDDPETDWTRVDIEALRDHLVDMDNVTTKASVERFIGELSVTFTVTGDDVTSRSSQRYDLGSQPDAAASDGLDRQCQRTLRWCHNGGASVIPGRGEPNQRARLLWANDHWGASPATPSYDRIRSVAQLNGILRKQTSPRSE